MKLSEIMYQVTLNKHAKFHGDQTIGGAITVEKVSKHKIYMVNGLKLFENAHIFTQKH